MAPEIIVVSGLPRSGTSLMMQMLDNGGGRSSVISGPCRCCSMRVYPTAALRLRYSDGSTARTMPSTSPAARNRATRSACSRGRSTRSL